MLIWIHIFAGAILGSLIGSFLNVVIWRGPILWGLVSEESASRGNLFGPRSCCPACRSTLKARHNIPLVSYFILGGRCANCSIAISRRYPIVEFLGAVVGVGAVWVFGLTLSGVFAALFLWSMIVIAAIDWETGFIPDAMTFPLILGGLGVNANGMFVSWSDAFIGVFAGYSVFWAVSASYKALRGREGLGLGDAKLLGALGAWIGWALLPMVVFMAAVSALLLIFIARLSGRHVNANTEIAFGPSLALAGSIIFLTQHALALAEQSIGLH